MEQESMTAWWRGVGDDDGVDSPSTEAKAASRSALREIFKVMAAWLVQWSLEGKTSRLVCCSMFDPKLGFGYTDELKD